MGIYFFFSGKDFSEAQLEKSIKIGACYTDMSNSYFDVVNKEIKGAIEEQGDILIIRDSGMNQETQNEQIENLVEQGVEAIFIAPVDPKIIENTLIKVKDKGIKIIMIDSGVYDNGLIDCSITSDNYNAGVQLANYLLNQASSAKILILKQSNMESCMERVKGFEDTILGHDGYEIIGSEECGGQLDLSIVAMRKLMSKNSDFDFVFAINDPSAMGALAVIEEENLSNKVKIISVDGSPEGKSLVKAGKIKATVAQFPTELGKKAVERMYDLLTDRVVEKEILIPTKLIIKNTIESYDTDKWQ
jgi:ribose transport system substrate-binding protein